MIEIDGDVLSDNMVSIFEIARQFRFERTLTDIGSLPMQSTKIYDYFQRKIAPLFLAGKVPLCSAPSPSVKAGWSVAPSQAAAGRLALTARDGVEQRGAVSARNSGPFLRYKGT